MKYYYYTCVTCDSRFYCDSKIEPLIDRIDSCSYNWIAGCCTQCRTIHEIGGMKKPSMAKTIRSWLRWLVVPEQKILPVPDIAIDSTKLQENS